VPRGTQVHYLPLAEPYSFVFIPPRGVREDNFISDAQAADDFNRNRGRSTQGHLNASGMLSVGLNSEEANRRLLLSERRAGEEHGVRDPFDLDRRLNGKVRPRTRGRVPRESAVDGHGAIMDGGIDINNPAANQSGAAVNGDALPDADVNRLSGRDQKARPESGRLCHPRQARPSCDLLTRLYHHVLKNARHPGPNV